MLTRYQRKKLMESIQIIDVFRHYNIRLQHDGCGRFRCNCPFHIDKTPSLKVYPEENSWYAFCCSKGSNVWDFIRHKEGDYREAETVLKELATIELPEDPLDDLIQELREEEKSQQKERVDAVAYLIGISLRDFLIRKKETKEYPDFCIQVDIWFNKLDELLTFEDLELSEIRDFETQVKKFIGANK